MNLQRGMRGKLAQYFDISCPLEISMQTVGTAVYDYCCFGVDAASQLSDDRYMIFYNQTRSPNGEITCQTEGNGIRFFTALQQLPAAIQKLVFTVSIDGSGTMGQISGHTLTIQQSGHEPLVLQLAGKDFQQEKAIISVEIYQKDGWRFSVVARGFNGGLGDLLRVYGGEEAKPEAAPPPPPPVPQKVSLEKKLAEHAPELVSLAKPIMVELKKKNIQDVIARVALVIDISGSMTGRFSDGTVQQIVNKILPLAVQFDDDGELDFWYYGSRCKRMDAVTMQNYSTAVPYDWQKLMRKLGYGNNEPVVMKEVIDEYQRSKLPAYVIFVTDGGIYETGKIKKLLVDSSRYPIFWQFVGVGGSDYGILEDFDNMSGRYVDNANFFALDDFRSVPNTELYSRLLGEFPEWLKEARRLHIF